MAEYVLTQVLARERFVLRYAHDQVQQHGQHALPPPLSPLLFPSPSFPLPLLSSRDGNTRLLNLPELHISACCNASSHCLSPQAEKVWKRGGFDAQAYRSLSDLTICILGVGEIGRVVSSNPRTLLGKAAHSGNPAINCCMRPTRLRTCCPTLVLGLTLAFRPPPLANPCVCESVCVLATPLLSPPPLTRWPLRCLGLGQTSGAWSAIFQRPLFLTCITTQKQTWQRPCTAATTL